MSGADGSSIGAGGGSRGGAAGRIRRVVFEPLGDGWLARLRGGAAADVLSLRVRRGLGLPDDRAIVATGHQPGAWHAGIVAKELAADALGERFGGAWASLSVDHQGERLVMRVPARDGSGRLVADERSLEAGADEGGAERAIGWRGAFAVVPLELLARGLAVDVGATRIGAYRAALEAGAALGSAAAQLDAGMDGLLGPVVRGVAWPMSSTGLSRLDEFAAFVRAMVEDSGACVGSYNEAVAAEPGSGIAPLGGVGDDMELPVWVMDERGVGSRGTVGGVLAALDGGWVDGMGRARIVPRAIAMTGFVRRAACDVFVHGTGGGGYDGVADRWLRSWLGWALAPVVVVTADVEAAIHAVDVSEADVARARWSAHRALHDPAMVGDAARGARKRALVDEIAGYRAGGDRAGAAAAYAALQALLGEHRAANGAAVAGFAERAEQVARAWSERGLAHDRGWSACVHGAGVLEALRAALVERMEAAVARADGVDQ